MGNTSDVKHFKANPVEIAIFLAVTAVFGNSLYKLFYDSPGFQGAALTRMAANPTSEGRTPASTAQSSFANVDIKCEPTAEQDTTAVKVRLTGPFCGLDPTTPGRAPSSTDAGKLVKTVVVNTTNRFNATVFNDVNAAKFSTDYIPLNPGRNPIQMEFTYRDGKVVSHELVVNKL